MRSKSQQAPTTNTEFFTPFADTSGAVVHACSGKRALLARVADTRPVRSLTTFLRSRKSAVPVTAAILFGAVNLISYLRMPESSTIDDGFVYFGWPFDIYARGGFVTGEAIIWTGLLGNIVVALCVARLLRRFLTKS